MRGEGQTRGNFQIKRPPKSSHFQVILNFKLHEEILATQKQDKVIAARESEAREEFPTAGECEKGVNYEESFKSIDHKEILGPRKREYPTASGRKELLYPNCYKL